MSERQKYSPGTILEYKNKNYYIVLAPNEFRNIPKNTVVGLFSGEIRSLDWLEEPKEITHLEIMW